MGSNYFWQNFNIGLGFGLLNSLSGGHTFMTGFNPFGFNYCCNMFSPFNSLRSPFMSGYSFMVPNYNTSFYPLMHETYMPTPTMPAYDSSIFDFSHIFDKNEKNNQNAFTQNSTFIPLNNNFTRPAYLEFPTVTQNNFPKKQSANNFTEYTVSSEKTTKAKTKSPVKQTSSTISDSDFDKMLGYILSQEGGYANHPCDRGGETNKGIIKTTYDDYRRRKGLPTRSVKEITDDEVREIYYEFYTKCGADKIADRKMALMVFDVAVGSGVSRAKKMYQESGGDIDTFEQLRRQFYANIVERNPSQEVFIKGWNNRVTHCREFADKNFSSSFIA